MSKLTPKQAFEHLKAVFPWLTEIRRTLHSTRTILIGLSLPGVDIETHEIDWGETKSYKPEKWRQATVEDVKRALDGQSVAVRNGASLGGYYIIGFINSTLPMTVIVSGDVQWPLHQCEVLDE